MTCEKGIHGKDNKDLLSRALGIRGSGRGGQQPFLKESYRARTWKRIRLSEDLDKSKQMSGGQGWHRGSQTEGTGRAKAWTEMQPEGSGR